MIFWPFNWGGWFSATPTPAGDITADTTLYFADSTLVTADGGS